ncbi:MAG: VOC family protein [Nakamurella sp.]
MALEWEQVVIDCADPLRLARWWADALGWEYWAEEDDYGVEIRPSEERLPGLIFGTVPEGKTVKNRLHLDFRPDNQNAEVDRLLGLGATRADVGQRSQSWVVLADPEGNEFCILGSRRPSG